MTSIKQAFMSGKANTEYPPPTSLCYVASSASILTKREAGNSVFNRGPRQGEDPNQWCSAGEQPSALEGEGNPLWARGLWSWL